MPPTDTWITIVEADVLASINNAELTAALTIQLANGQAAPLTVLIPDVTEEVRSYCRNKNTVGLPGTLPQELKNAAIDIIIYRALRRARKSAAAKEVKMEYDDAMKKLERVASGDLKITAPLNVSTDVTQAPGPAFDRPHSEGFGYNEERGV